MLLINKEGCTCTIYFLLQPNSPICSRTELDIISNKRILINLHARMQQTLISFQPKISVGKPSGRWKMSLLLCKAYNIHLFQNVCIDMLSSNYKLSGWWPVRHSFPGISKAIQQGVFTGTKYLCMLECTFILQMSF